MPGAGVGLAIRRQRNRARRYPPGSGSEGAPFRWPCEVARFPPMASVGPEDRSIRGDRNQVTFDLYEYAAGLNKSASPDDQKRTMVSLPEHSHDALELKFAGLLME